MKKSLVTLAMLSMTALLFTACNKGEEATPATEEPAATVEPAAEVPVVEAPVVEVEAVTESAAEVKTE